MNCQIFNLPEGKSFYLAYIYLDGFLEPGGGIPLLVDNDGFEYPLLEGYALSTQPLPNTKSKYETAVSDGQAIGDEKPFDHNYVKEDLTWSVMNSKYVFYHEEFEQQEYVWDKVMLESPELNGTYVLLPVRPLSDRYKLSVSETCNYHEFVEYWDGTYFIDHASLTLVPIDDHHYKGVMMRYFGFYLPDGTPYYEKGPWYEDRYPNYTGYPYMSNPRAANLRYLARKVDDMLVNLYYSSIKLFDEYPDKHWDASLRAAEGVNAYDLNMVEALLNFGIDDIIPKGLSESTTKMIVEAINGSPATRLLRSVQIAGSFYLYNKYIIGNNISDICQITGVDPDMGANISRIVDGLSKDGANANDYNWQLMRVAQRIVYGKDYFISTYGGIVHRPLYGPGQAKINTNCKLLALPGALYDASVAGILTDEFGLKLTATRLSETIPLEFVANWFIPIEDTINSIENNSVALNQRFNVISITLSDKIVVNYDLDYLDAMFALDNARGSVRGEFYHRFVLDHFPRTEFSFSSDYGGINMSRILQGGSILIS